MNAFTDYLNAPRQTTNSRKPKQTPLFNGLRNPDHHINNIEIVGAEQGRADTHRRDSIKRGASI